MTVAGMRQLAINGKGYFSQWFWKVQPMVRQPHLLGVSSEGSSWQQQEACVRANCSHLKCISHFSCCCDRMPK
jgi:hypothetical protein